MELEDYLGLVDFATPCGLVCKLCGGGFRANIRSLAHHAKTCPKIHGVSFRFPGRHLGKKIQKLVVDTKNQPFDCFIHQSNDTQIKYFCGDCGKMFPKKHLCQGHTEECSDKAEVMAKTCYKLKCGSFCPMPDADKTQTSNRFAHAESSHPSDDPWNSDQTATILQPILESPMGLRTYTSMFHGLACQYREHFTSQMIQLVQWTRPETTREDPVLLEILQGAEVWIKDHVRLHVHRTPGNFRAALVVLDGMEIDEVNQNNTFTFRHNDDVIGRELKKLLCFIFRQNISPQHQRSLRDCDRNDLVRSIPRILLGLFMEPIQKLSQDCLVVKYCLSWMCCENEGSLTFVQPGNSASMCSDVLCLL